MFNGKSLAAHPPAPFLFSLKYVRLCRITDKDTHLSTHLPGNGIQQVNLFNYRVLITVTILIIATAVTGILRLNIDTDIVRSLPSGETVISDALEIFSNHPIHDQIAVDITLDKDDPDILVECGTIVKKRLCASNLFSEVGTDKISSLIPDLALFVTANLPVLFSAQELEQDIAPRLEESFINQRFENIIRNLSSLEGIGQSKFITSDPLGFMEPVMARMAMLAPVAGTGMYKGFIFSADNRHILVTARPNNAGTNTASAKQITALLNSVSEELTSLYHPDGISVTLTPVGAYRAALDNESIIRHDVNMALLLSTIGIGLLLFFAFPRPLLGLFALLPALAGSAVSLFLFSLFHSSISIMVLGFGGAIISITVDHGIAYLLFLDRPQKTRGKDASREIRAIGILAVLTTCGAFLTLSFSGFPIFVQLGQFAAMGVFFSFLFVHFIFPRITPSMEPSLKKRKLPLQGMVDKLYNTGKIGGITAALFACIMLFSGQPDFHVDLESMNSVSKETLAADTLFTKVWGNISNKTVLMISEDSTDALQQKNDQVLKKIEADTASKIIESAFVPSMIFPGRKLAAKNFMDWKEFWDSKRVAQLSDQLGKKSIELGFTAESFDQFLELFTSSYTPQDTNLPAKFQKLMGISEKDGKLIQFINIRPGENYDSQSFYDHYGTDGKIFDSPYFSSQLADILFNSFATMLAIIAVSIALLLLLFFASWQLTLITLLPPLFSYICTLGTMKLIGHPLDIPGLMLSIVILGMGIDYSIFFVRAHQRYRDPAHPSFTLVRMAVFMAGASTIIGFGILCLADHSLLRSIGITSLLGIGYSLLGAFLLLPPLLNFYFTRKPSRKNGTDPAIAARVRDRYQLIEAYPRMFARFKLQTDPMFTDLSTLLKQDRERIKTVLDIGCGYGVPGCWCLEYLPNSTVLGVDPNPERVRVATLAMEKRGEILKDAAPDLPILPNPPDLVLLLDMLHYLDNNSVRSLFANCFQVMNNNGLLLARFVIRPDTAPSWSWKLEDFRTQHAGSQAYYRTIDAMGDLMAKAGFHVELKKISDTNKELVWLLGRVKR
ncbi:MAG TPA: methyltransferase domain-containing protein [Desulfobacterales bacterium]|nr:methyltransferase domain-containing protein [Desulfobacterales bacterium]HIP38225.1 methyltransferase domain-containing protein [Desulfocapsa sulfexigens]